MKRLILLFPFLACVLLAAAFSNCARAGLQVEWELVLDDQNLRYGARLETDGPRLFLGKRDGFYMSRDHGHTWDLTLPDRSITCIAFGLNTVYAGTYYHGLYRSETRGNTWKPNNKGFAFDDNPDWPGDYSPIEQILVTRSGMVIAVKYHSGIYISRGRGDSWTDMSDQWLVGRRHIGYSIWSMTEFDDYLWACTGTGWIIRAPSGKPNWWDSFASFKDGRIFAWEALNDRLYAASNILGRWNEAKHRWDYFSEDFQSKSDSPHFTSLAVNRGRLFVGLRHAGVHLFDERTETFIPAGLQEFPIADVISHQGDLYAAVEGKGVYRASIPTVQPYGKSATTWGALKTK